MNKDNFTLGIDIGGTKIATGLVTNHTTILNRTIVPTPQTDNVNVVMDQVFHSIEETLRQANLDESAILGIGVASPGPLDPKSGILFHAPNIPAFQDTPILSLIQNRYGRPTRVENDANAAGLAEALFGAATGYDYVLYVTISTGIGTGIIIHQQIYHGKHGLAGEGGHVLIDYQGRICGCGRHGCIEAYASGPALVRRTTERLSLGQTASKIVELASGNLNKVTPIVIAEAAQLNDDLALSLISETGRYLAIWLGSMVNVLDPEIIVIGGGVSSIGTILFDTIRDELKKHTMNPMIRNVRIVPAQLRKDVGIIGAASLHAIF